MSGSEGLGRTVARSAIWVVIEQWSTKFISLGLFAVMARLLSAADFGIVALATAITAILSVFVNSGFSKALIQKKVLGEKDASTAFWTSLGISVVLYVALALASPALAAWLGEPELEPILLALGVTLPLSALSRTPAALLSREFAFKSLSLRTMIATLLGALVALPLALAGAGAWALVAQSLAETVVAVVVLWTSTPWRPRFVYSRDSLRSLWGTGVSLLGIELLDAVQSQIDKLVIGAVFSTTELGIYSVAQRLGLTLQELISSVITKLSLPTFSKAQDDLPRVGRIFRQLSFTTATVSFPVFALVAVLGPQIVPFLFGPRWADAVPLIWVLAGGWAFASVAMFDRGALVGTGHAGAAFWLALVQNAISIGLVFLFIPLGLIGIAFSRFARIITWPIRLYALHRHVKLPVLRYVWQVLRCAIAVAPVVIGIALLQQTPWAHSEHSFWTFAVPLGAVGFLVIVALNWLLADAESRQPLRSQVGHVLRRRRRGSAAGES